MSKKMQYKKKAMEKQTKKKQQQIRQTVNMKAKLNQTIR